MAGRPPPITNNYNSSYLAVRADDVLSSLSTKLQFILTRSEYSELLCLSSLYEEN